MNPEEYVRMHALETDYWWFAGRREIVGSLLEDVIAHRDRKELASHALELLDIGCGTGANLPMLLGIVGPEGAVTGLDYSPVALRFSRDHAVAASARLLQGDAEHLPFADGTFDVVTMLDVLEHVRDDRQALREVHRVLRPHGAFVFSVPAYQHLWSAHDEALHHFRRYEFCGLKALLRESGFDERRVSFAMSIMPPLAWFWRKFVLPFKPRRPREAKRHSEGAVLPTVPPFMNRALIAYLRAEGRLIKRHRLCFGTSLVGVVFKIES